MKNLVQSRLANSLDVIDKIHKSERIHQKLIEAAEVITDSYLKDGCPYFAGNGGSAADSQHIVAELVSRLERNREPLRAYALTVDTSTLTAVGNDYGYDKVFSRQVEGLMRPQDALISITTSGNSVNVLNAMVSARNKGCKNILFTGGTGGKCIDYADVAIVVPSSRTANIQEGHIVLYHILCELTESMLFEKGLVKYT